MINGIYRFYQGENLIHEEKNALTVAGRTIAMKSLLGIIPNFADHIGYGIGNKANTLTESSQLISDNTLQFEIGREKVVGARPEISNNNDSLVYSAVINDPFQFLIYEVGLFPPNIQNGMVGVRGATIFDFDRVDNFSKYGTASAAALTNMTDTRLGTQILSIPKSNGTTGYISYVTSGGTLADLTKYTSQDTFRLAGIDANNTSSSIIFRFYTDATNYYELTFTTPTASGYFISELQKGSAAVTGSPSWENITSVSFWQNNNSLIYLDGLKIDIGSYVIDSTSGMISRAVLTTPVRKPAGVPITVEYSLSVDFNYGIS